MSKLKLNINSIDYFQDDNLQCATVDFTLNDMNDTVDFLWYDSLDFLEYVNSSKKARKQFLESLAYVYAASLETLIDDEEQDSVNESIHKAYSIYKTLKPKKQNLFLNVFQNTLSNKNWESVSHIFLDPCNIVTIKFYS
jgi:hypothetical protein